MEKEINVLALAPGEKPRDVTLRNSIEAVEEFLGGPAEAMPLKRNGVYASVVMFSRVADLDAADRNPAGNGPIPGPSILCSVKGNDLISLPPDRREAYLRSYERFGDMALTEERVPPMLRVRVAGVSDKGWRDFLSRIGMDKVTGGGFQ
jgi:hypothetical protein